MRQLAGNAHAERRMNTARHTTTFVRLAASAALLILSGCASFHTGRGDRAVERGDWDAAYSSYSSALRSDPGNIELGKSSDRLDTEACAFHAEA